MLAQFMDSLNVYVLAKGKKGGSKGKSKKSKSKLEQLKIGSYLKVAVQCDDCGEEIIRSVRFMKTYH